MNDAYAIQKKLPISEATRARNPDLFGPVGGLPDTIPQPDPLPALDKIKKARKRSSRRMVLSVEIISVRKRNGDYLNIASGCKGIQDAIAKTLGVDDADPCVEWSFHQIKTTGREGTIVNIQEL